MHTIPSISPKVYGVIWSCTLQQYWPVIHVRIQNISRTTQNIRIITGKYVVTLIYFTCIFFCCVSCSVLHVFHLNPAASSPKAWIHSCCLGYCTCTPHDLQGEIENNVRGHRRAAASMGGGMGRMGSRWQWLCPISTTEGGLKMATGPPHINSIQGDALSSRQLDTFLTTSTPPDPQPQITPLEMLNQSSGYLQYYIKVKGRAYHI